ncbi:glyoxalase/bleomycin resistance protein/dioxygenase superfamily protein [Streptomyces sp. 3212.3]|uniref:VOC family protein n=1 Tax=Streptomyces sp. 3212.3 TaxID=1938846 RepID=UPI000E252B8A|nr:VOC family protein [Streptomyces sp. 3212.3]REE57668.1 glyoxalase/bleomycin resistance protein/dioxygenase superfamily protein [Streptomyces sp. 3212.3]
MASRLNPYLMFAGDARQALQFYKEVFGGTLVLSTYGEAGQPDTSMADKIMHGMLETPSDYTLMAADIPAGEHKPGNAYSVSLSNDEPLGGGRRGSRAVPGEVPAPPAKVA